MRDEAHTARRRHFKHRVKQRYGIDLNRRDILAITRIISEGRFHGKPVRLTKTRRACPVEWEGTRIWIVWSTTREEVVTALTQDMVDGHRGAKRGPDPDPDLAEEVRRRWGVRLFAGDMEKVTETIRKNRSLDATAVDAGAVAHLVEIRDTGVWWRYRNGRVTGTMSRRWEKRLEASRTRTVARAAAVRLVDCGHGRQLVGPVGRDRAVTILASCLASGCEHDRLEKIADSGVRKLSGDVRNAMDRATRKIGYMTGLHMHRKESVGFFSRILRLFRRSP